MSATSGRRETCRRSRETPDSSEVTAIGGRSSLPLLAHAASAKEVSHVPYKRLNEVIRLARDLIRLALEALRFYKNL